MDHVLTQRELDTLSVVAGRHDSMRDWKYGRTNWRNWRKPTLPEAPRPAQPWGWDVDLVVISERNDQREADEQEG